MNNEIKKVTEILLEGGVAVFPTDTVYGIGTLPREKSVRKIYEIKKRDFSKKIIALIDDISRLDKIISETFENIEKILPVLEKFWPGELTVIFKANTEFTSKFDKELETIGVRIPKNETALDIIKNTGGILLTTSANISGEEAVTELDKLSKEIREKADYVIGDNSKLTGKPSTIIKYENGNIGLLRKGNISSEDIKKAMKG
ncbi:L-threonylcarbamoyladenylate synthase [Pseudoleptotrichia goodfellowii]|uniref:L-threonylcarbamoyladenylate synthase n=1 Tax=Pseudoleptotrichia goodfellowii TaxID=157692 RepID=A0A510J8U6_9FUSO|nr:L-threonylcarbamoyladenylate synthase [Pseudoleptotrichia goodfellowii]BBM35719.1 Sua5/YciO/YrdC/YwlC family protein [Pseudoleptotrichia goodfellowii]